MWASLCKGYSCCGCAVCVRGCESVCVCWVYVITCTPVDSSTFTHSFNRYRPCCPVPALLRYCSGTPSWHPAQIPRRSWRVKVISTALWQPLPAPAPTPATIANDFHFRIEMNAPLVVAASRVLQAEADEAEAELMRTVHCSVTPDVSVARVWCTVGSGWDEGA